MVNMVISNQLNLGLVRSIYSIIQYRLGDSHIADWKLTLWSTAMISSLVSIALECSVVTLGCLVDLLAASASIWQRCLDRGLEIAIEDREWIIKSRPLTDWGLTLRTQKYGLCNLTKCEGASRLRTMHEANFYSGEIFPQAWRLDGTFEVHQKSCYY